MFLSSTHLSPLPDLVLVPVHQSLAIGVMTINWQASLTVTSYPNSPKLDFRKPRSSQWRRFCEHPESHANTCVAIPSFLSVTDDPDKWILDDATLEHLVQNGVKQNMDADLSSSKCQYADTTRYLSLSLFIRILPDNEKRPQPWPVF